jgi:hypothetical protein
MHTVQIDGDFKMPRHKIAYIRILETEIADGYAY